MLSLLWTLFYTFFVIGLFNFGGGGAMISLIQARVVTEHAWLTEEGFTNIVAISQTTPGPIGINCATYVGFEVMHNAGFSNAVSILGSAATTLAIVLPGHRDAVQPLPREPRVPGHYEGAQTRCRRPDCRSLPVSDHQCGFQRLCASGAFTDRNQFPGLESLGSVCRGVHPGIH